MIAARNLLTITLALLAFVAVSLSTYRYLQVSHAQPEFATVWPAPKPLPDISLVDQSGNEFSRDSLRGRWSLLFFGFTHCPDICPATLQQLAIAHKRLLESGHEAPDIIFVSVDPERDSVAALASYVSHFGNDILGVTGDLAELRKLTSAAGIFFEKSTQPDGSYSVDHSAVVLVVNADGAIRASFSTPHDIDHFVNDMPILMGSD